MDAKILISLSPGKDIPTDISINILNEFFCCPVEVLGGSNACFLCRKEGHPHRDCPIIKKKPNPSNSSPKDDINLLAANNIVQTNTPKLSTPPSSSSRPLPEKIPNVLNHTESDPFSAIIVQPHANYGRQQLPNLDSAIDLNNDDSFTVVPQKKKVEES